MSGDMQGVTGYPVTTANEKALESFNAGVKAYVSLNGNCMLHLTAALEKDPDFLLVHCVLVRIFRDLARTLTVTKQRESLESVYQI